MKFYVYHLVDPNTNIPFYVGKGTGDRANSHLKKYDNHNNYKKNKIISIRKQGLEPIVNIIFECDSEGEAWQREIEEISKYGRKNIDDNGILTNRSKGGAGGDTSMCFTDETRKKLKAKSTGINNSRSKFTESDVRDIFLSCDKTTTLAKKYSVSTSTIKDIKRQTYYKNITDNLGPPGYHQTLRRIPINDETVKDIFYFSGTAKDFKTKFNCSLQVARNIKFGVTYQKITAALPGEAGEIKIHKLTWDDICDIRESDEPIKNIAEQYGITKETVYNIRNEKTRKYQ